MNKRSVAEHAVFLVIGGVLLPVLHEGINHGNGNGLKFHEAPVDLQQLVGVQSSLDAGEVDLCALQEVCITRMGDRQPAPEGGFDEVGGGDIAMHDCIAQIILGPAIAMLGCLAEELFRLRFVGIDIPAKKQRHSEDGLCLQVIVVRSAAKPFDALGNVLRGKANHADVGVMQINEKYHADQAKKLGYDIYTAEGNVAFAKYLYAKYGTDPWSSSEVCWAGSNGLAKN